MRRKRPLRWTTIERRRAVALGARPFEVVRTFREELQERRYPPFSFAPFLGSVSMMMGALAAWGKVGDMRKSAP